MITISLCMIVKNEQDTLPRCLDSVQGLIDEIVIVDTGSTDRTVEIAKTYTDRVETFPWCDDFAAARNFSFSLARKEYCLWLDADDVFLPDDREKFRQLKESLSPKTDMVMLPYHTALDEEGRPTFTCYRERLVRSHAGFLWQGAVHEAIPPRGEIVYGDAAVTHRKLRAGEPGRNLRILESLRQKGPLEPRQQFYYGRELYDHKAFAKAIPVLESFLQDGQGWIENNIDACRLLYYCYTQIQKPEAGLSWLLESLKYDAPRAEICCEIGQYFLERHAYPPAIFWYETAASRPRSDYGGGFVLPDCYGYIPFLQLCVCYDRLGDPAKAAEYNEKAGKLKPSSPAVQYNRRYFLSQGILPSAVDGLPAEGKSGEPSRFGKDPDDQPAHGNP